MSSHVCPIIGCNALVPGTKLMCVKHWRSVSRETGAELYNAYRLAPRTPRHVAAMKAAIAEVEGRER